jgi:tetratricopeptide (TPR) repeat protein
MAYPTQTPLKFLRLTCALLTLIGLGCDGSDAEAKKAKHLERAEAYFTKGQYQEAILEYKNVTQLDAKDAAAHYQLALAHLKLGGLTNLQAAFAELSRTVELDQSNREAQIKLGELYLLSNEPAKARERAEIVLVSAPQHADGLILKGRSLINEKKHQEGIAELKKAIELDPKNMQVYIDLARAYYAVHDEAAAEGALNQALSVNPRSVEILLVLADFRNTTGKPDQAEALYKQALGTAPDNEDLYLELARHFQRRNKLADAEATLQKLATLKPQKENP